MLNRIINRIRNHDSFVSKHQRGEISDKEFEKFLIDEIEYLEQDLEKKLNDRILEEQEKLLNNIEKIKNVVVENNIDKSAFENLIYSEFNYIYLTKHVL